jgi:hypothetical protein
VQEVQADIQVECGNLGRVNKLDVRDDGKTSSLVRHLVSIAIAVA